MKKIVILFFLLLNSVVNAQEDKTVTLTVSGTGKTLEEAKLNALRSAIEQAFGAFISSKTEILNDNLIKDEIVSVTNGNIQKYDVVTEVTLPKGSFAITLNATVSIGKLTTFAESKGVVIEFKGGMFGANIKLQKLNEKNELEACINLFGIMHETLQTSYDYSVITEDPVLYKDDVYKVKYRVDAVPNQTYKSIYDYYEKSLESLKMTTEEIDAYKKINKEIFEIKTPTSVYYLRNELSKQTLDNLNQLIYYYSGNFKILINNDEINVINGPDLGFIEQWNGDHAREFWNTEITKCSYFMGDIYDLSFDQNTNSNSYVKNNNGKITYSWGQFYPLKELENISKITIQGKGLKSNFKYGGFVVYNHDNKLIIVAPYTLKPKNEKEDNNGEHYFNINDLYWKPEKTSETIFSGKANTELFKDETQTNTLYSILNNFNVKNNTNWFIPSKEELIIAMKELYKFSYHQHISYISSTISPSRYGSNNYAFKQLFIYDDFKINSNSFSNDKLKKYINGNPFNISDFLENSNKSDIGYQMGIKEYLLVKNLMLIKYIELNK